MNVDSAEVASPAQARVGLDRWDALMLVAMAVGVALMHIPMRAGYYSDQGIYAGMAQDPLGSVPPAPFRFRIATTLLAAYLPFSVQTNFLLITTAAMAGTAALIRRTAHHLAGPLRGLVAMGLFATSGIVLLTMRTPYATEPLSLLAGAAGLELGRRERWLEAGLVVAAGAAARETTLFVLLPLGVWSVMCTKDSMARARALTLLILPGVAMYLLLHRTPVLYGVIPGERVQSPSDILDYNLRVEGGFGRYLLMVLFGSLGLMWVYLRAMARSRERFVATSVLLVLPLLAGCAIASDWGRILGYGVIVASTGVAVVAPWRVLKVLVPCQVVATVFCHQELPYLSALVAVLFLIMVARTGGLHDRDGALEAAPPAELRRA